MHARMFEQYRRYVSMNVDARLNSPIGGPRIHECHLAQSDCIENLSAELSGNPGKRSSNGGFDDLQPQLGRSFVSGCTCYSRPPRVCATTSTLRSYLVRGVKRPG